MSLLAPTSPLSRLVAWLVVVVMAAAALYWAAGQQLSRYLKGTERLERLADQSSRYQYLAGQKPIYEDQLADLDRQRPRWRGQYLKATEPNLAAAEMQQLLTRTLRAQGITVDRMDVRPQTQDTLPEGVAQVSAQIQLTADYSLFLAALRDLENMTPLLVLDEVSVQPVLTRGTLRRPDARQVSVRLTVRALHLREDGS